jgi:CRP-like cAMP-binding protein
LKLADLFGGGAVVRVLDVLLSKPSLPWNRSLLASSCGLDPRTLRRVLPRLRSLGVVVDGGFGVIEVDEESALVQALAALYKTLQALESA